MFGSVKAADCPESFTYGRDGQPLYVGGPDDDDERIDRILRTLTAKLGRDGFHYILKPYFDTLAALAGVGENSPEAELVPEAGLAERIGAALLALRAAMAPRGDGNAPARGE